MLIKKSQVILKCFVDFKSSIFFTLGSEDETMFCDTQNFFQLNCRSRFSKHLMTSSPILSINFTNHKIQVNQSIICWLKKSSKIYWEYKTAGHLVFSTPWPAVKLKKFPRVTKHSLVFWAQHKPNATLEIYVAFLDCLTFLIRHVIV